MLSKLTIKNVALIDSAEIEFCAGLNVLSGETGAGKSVILDSVNFVLGAKADKTMIRYGETECMVKAEFSVPEESKAVRALREMDIDTDGDIIISRRFSESGKSSIKLNGNTVTVPVNGWTTEDYDRKSAGWYNFTADVDVSSLGRLSNAFGVKATARVWVSAGIDTDAINIYIGIAESLNESDYTPESWAEMAQKLTVALEIIGDPYAVQNSVGVASFQLKDAIDALVNIHQDKTALEDEIKKCKETYFEEAYTKISYGYYLEALTSAEEIFASNIVSQKEIDEVLSELKKAENSLIALGDKTVLNGAIEEVKALKKSDYTAESYAAVKKALKDAERILALDAPTLKQTEIAAENLENATKELVSVSTEQKGSESESSGCNGALGIPLFGVGAAVGLVLKKRRK